MGLGALSDIRDSAELFQIQSARRLGTNQQAANIAVIEVWM